MDVTRHNEMQHNNDNNDNISGNDNTSSQTMRFQNAVWPESLPHANEEHIFTLLCGNTHVNWSLHMGAKHKFAAKLHWRTPAFTKDSDSADPCDLLANFIPQPAQDIFFGEHRDLKKNTTPSNNGVHGVKQAAAATDAAASATYFTEQNATKAAAARAVAKLTVYVVSSNPEHEQGIEFIFSKIPVRLVRLQATDFYTAAQGLYPGMGVDRVASLKAASALFGYPALVLDGGTAMTYTAADCQGNIVGGGILPGLRVKLASLHDYTGSLPLITCQKLLETVQACSEEARETLPVFARDTETAILSAVLKETAVNLKGIIQAFVRQMRPDLPREDEVMLEDDDKVNRDFSICLTGGDHPILEALLTANHRHVVQADPVNPADLDFYVFPYKHLGTTGMQRVIWETYQEFNTDAMEEAEDVVSSAMTAEVVVESSTVSAEVVLPAAEAAAAAAAARSLAVAAPTAAPAASPPVVKSPVPVALATTPVKEELPAAASGSSAKRTRNAVEKDVSVPKAKAKKPKVEKAKAETPKGKKAKTVVQSSPQPSPSSLFFKNNPLVKKVPKKTPQRPMALDDSSNDEELVEAKADEDEDNEDAPEPASASQTKYMDRRVAKYFGKDLYFGSVDEFYNPDGVDLWHVTYDDGDQEDFELDELIPAFEEYRKNKNKDPEAEPSFDKE